MSEATKRVRVRHFAQAKQAGTKIVGLTSYDFLTAGLFDQAEVDFLLVGDSAGNVVFGYDTTVPTTTDELIPLARGVVRAAKRALVVADLPFGSYESGPDDALHTAVRFMKESEVHAVKLEGGVRSAAQIERLVQSGIPVMGHIGYTPQSEHGLGGHVVQGRGDARESFLADAKAVEAAGAFAVVIEMVPEALAAEVSQMLTIPTIGIGAGRHTDGQILVWTDLLGVATGRLPRFVRQYASLGQEMIESVSTWRDDVRSGAFPDESHVFED
ncbi:3-methyl-2-oxobutanoate hydroxymethyltransferase [Pontimonas salivibrio]|jgi:3-methyl-2-oxobutanoate hydroxymethyltransferase|uniref:3-methyl-2-oxobutanoate hydroxymethyltransferase n=1 Tax=Pontimonas salivibrio TaxID=1159327 RepID=A0A2L2BQE1_9MICO|nr:3-methyl-2-oxobutanoate hydroxymethyltransferase [Pontimonas salivibrio]AVG23886.1 3-methyl-2-oxobutanoate hydroxymethyltransferase [Pontimonas salivibrio]